MSSAIHNAVIRGKVKPQLQELSSDFVVGVLDHDADALIVYVHGNLDLCKKLVQALQLRITELKKDEFRNSGPGSGPQ